MTIMSEFIDRHDEISYLEKEFKAPGFKFISLIGRRRVGKTRLIEEFIKSKENAVYFLVQELDDKELRLAFAERLHRGLKISFFGTPSWETIFEEIFNISENMRVVLVFDEFQRFSGINKSVPSILQGLIDKHARKSGLFLIVTGSSIGMMHKLFDYTSALYGRRTGQLYIQPLKPYHLKEWFPNISVEKMVEIYSVFGGTPKYLEDADPEKSIMENIKNSIVNKKSILYNEPEILVKTELPDSATYFNILKLISEGKTKPVEIAGSLSIKQTSLGYFLSILEKDMELIKREVVVTEKKVRTKKSIYKMNDAFFRFWFRYVYPYKSEIEIGNVEYVTERIEKGLNSFIGHSFEDVCKDILLVMNRESGLLPFKISKIGTWWGHKREDGIRKELEIDITAINEDTKDILFIECKWKENVDAIKVLKELKEKTGFVDWNNEGRREYYAVFARSFKEGTKEPNAMLFDIKDIEKIIAKADAQKADPVLE